MYNKNFAEIYNKEWVTFSQNLADNVLKITPCFDSVLDLGCGTGNFLNKLEKYFRRTVGIDLSKDMIEVAKLNCKNTEFYVKSVTDFDLKEKFDLITCNFDMINHLDSISDWEKMFRLVYNHLEDGGVFLFDINTVFKYGKLDSVESSYETDVYNICTKEERVDANHVKLNIDIFDKKGNKVASSEMVESFYDEQTILKSLKNAGFNNVTFTDMEFNEIDNFERNRLFLICKKK